MSIPIIMCTWQRFDGFANVIDKLNLQNSAGFELYVWNNNIERKKDFEMIANAAKFKVHFHHSENNIGGFGRFYSAKSLYEKDSTNEYCVFLDDDSELHSDSLQQLCLEAKPRTISATYGWTFNSPFYYDRYQPEHGSEIDYAGTAGMIAHMPVFCNELLYACPREYWFVEDLWLSYFATVFEGYVLYMSAAKISTNEYGNNLSDQTYQLKIDMLKAMVDNMRFKIGKTKKKQ